MKKETQQRIENKVRSRTSEKFDWMFYGRVTDNAPDGIKYSDIRFTVFFNLIAGTRHYGIYVGCEPHMFWAFTTDDEKLLLTEFLHARFPDLDFSVIPANSEEEQSSEVSA